MSGVPTDYSTFDLACLSGLTYRQVDYWCRVGALCPSIAARGSGSQRRFDENEVRVARAAYELGLMKCPLGVVKDAAVQMRRLFAAEPGFDGLLHVDADGHVSRTVVARSGWLVDVRPLDLARAS